MPAFTSFLLAASTAAGIAGVAQAKNTAAAQKNALAAQNAAAKEAAAQGTQVAGPDAEFVLGSSPLSKPSASNELLKSIVGKGSKATKIGGLKGAPTKIGGL